MMILINKWKIKFVISILFFILFVCTGCSKPLLSEEYINNSKAPAKNCSSAYIDVKGIVLGDIKQESKLFLYKISSFNYSKVMAEIRNQQPIDSSPVNMSKGFKFDCLCFGQYAFVIPTSSYNGSVGSALPYEFDCANVSLKISFQGGDPDYMVGAFLIERPGYENNSTCKKNPYLCMGKKGGLHRKCPFDE